MTFKIYPIILWNGENENNYHWNMKINLLFHNINSVTFYFIQSAMQQTPDIFILQDCLFLSTIPNDP